MTCRYCEQPVAPADSVTTVSYWSAIPYVCHRACKVTGVKQEAFDCQMLDRDCNDCRCFIRGEAVRKFNEAGQPQPISAFHGMCLKFDRQTMAFPNQSTGRECFEHRRENKC